MSVVFQDQGKLIDYNYESTYLSIKDEGGAFIARMVRTFPHLVNKAMGSAAWQTYKDFKGYPRAGGTKTEKWAPLSKMRLSRKLSTYHEARQNHSTGKHYGRLSPAIGYIKKPESFQVRFGWRSKTAFASGTRQEQGELHPPMKKKQQRHLAALGYKFKLGYQIKLPKRRLFEPIFRENKILFLERVETKLHEYRKRGWK